MKKKIKLKQYESVRVLLQSNYLSKHSVGSMLGASELSNIVPYEYFLHKLLFQTPLGGKKPRTYQTLGKFFENLENRFPK